MPGSRSTLSWAEDRKGAAAARLNGKLATVLYARASRDSMPCISFFDASVWRTRASTEASASSAATSLPRVIADTASAGPRCPG